MRTTREDLEKIDGIRGKFTASFVRYGKAERGQKITLLFKDIKNEQGETITDHLWFNLSGPFEVIGWMREGEQIEFEARVKEYTKGMDHDVGDYKLAWPTKARLLVDREYIRLSQMI